MSGEEKIDVNAIINELLANQKKLHTLTADELSELRIKTNVYRKKIEASKGYTMLSYTNVDAEFNMRFALMAMIKFIYQMYDEYDPKYGLRNPEQLLPEEISQDDILEYEKRKQDKLTIFKFLENVFAFTPKQHVLSALNKDLDPSKSNRVKITSENYSLSTEDRTAERKKIHNAVKKLRKEEQEISKKSYDLGSRVDQINRQIKSDENYLNRAPKLLEEKNQLKQTIIERLNQYGKSEEIDKELEKVEREIDYISHRILDLPQHIIALKEELKIKEPEVKEVGLKRQELFDNIKKLTYEFSDLTPPKLKMPTKIPIPSHDIVYAYRNYADANYEEIKTLTESIWAYKSDFLPCIIVHSHCDTEDEGEKFIAKYKDEFPLDIIRIPNNEWVDLSPCSENRDSMTFDDEKAGLMKEIKNQREKDETFGKKLMNERIVRGKREQIRKLGLDSEDAKSQIREKSVEQSRFGLKRGLTEKEIKVLEDEYLEEKRKENEKRERRKKKDEEKKKRKNEEKNEEKNEGTTSITSEEEIQKNCENTDDSIKSDYIQNLLNKPTQKEEDHDVPMEFQEIKSTIINKDGTTTSDYIWIPAEAPKETYGESADGKLTIEDAVPSKH